MRIIYPQPEYTPEKLHKKALEIVEFIQSKTREYSEKHHLNFVLQAGAGENLVGRFAALDLQNLGAIEGINDRGYYSNSFQLNDELEIPWRQKLELEAPFHRLTPGGHFTFLQFPSPPQAAQVMEAVTGMAESGIGYGGISFQLNECMECGTLASAPGPCPNCGKDRIRKIRRVNTYLTLEEYLTPIQLKMLANRRPQLF